MHPHSAPSWSSCCSALVWSLALAISDREFNLVTKLLRTLSESLQLQVKQNLECSYGLSWWNSLYEGLGYVCPKNKAQMNPRLKFHNPTLWGTGLHVSKKAGRDACHVKLMNLTLWRTGSIMCGMHAVLSEIDLWDWSCSTSSIPGWVSLISAWIENERSQCPI